MKTGDVKSSERRQKAHLMMNPIKYDVREREIQGHEVLGQGHHQYKDACTEGDVCLEENYKLYTPLFKNNLKSTLCY